MSWTAEPPRFKCACCVFVFARLVPLKMLRERNFDPAHTLSGERTGVRVMTNFLPSIRQSLPGKALMGRCKSVLPGAEAQALETGIGTTDSAPEKLLA